MNAPLLLCFNLAPERASKIKFSAMRNGVHVRVVSPAEQELTLSRLCDGAAEAVDSSAPAASAAVAPDAAPPSEAFTDEMLVMARFTDPQITAFLQTLRRMKVSPVKLKAVLTDTNQSWTARALHRELALERQALKEGSKPLHQPQA